MDVQVKIIRLLGLAKRQGALIAGARACERSLKQARQAVWVLLAQDAGEASKRQFRHLCEKWTAPKRVYLECLTAEEQGSLTGKDRQSVLVLEAVSIGEEIERLLTSVAVEEAQVTE